MAVSIAASSSVSETDDSVGLVRTKLMELVRNTFTCSDRGLKLKQIGEKVIDRSCDGGKMQESFEFFAKSLFSWLEGHIKSTVSKYKSTSGKRSKLWSSFHQIRTKNDSFVRSTWKKLLTVLDVDEGGDWLLMQALLRKIFDTIVHKYFQSLKARADSESEITLTVDELNALRYACGYVARNLLKKFERQKTKEEKVFQFIACLGEMAVAGDGESVLSYTENWFAIVNRGGLFPLNENAFAMFIEIEKCVRYYLPQHALSSSADRESFTKNVHSKVHENEDVQFFWTLLSQDIDNPEHAEELLTEIIKLWVTVRGFSMTATWTEVYKAKEKKTLQKTTGLRKSISGCSNS